MLYLTREDSVGRLPLSTRASNCLRRANIHTVGQMLDYPPDAWLDIRNMGKKSVQEIMDLIARIQGDNGFSLTESRPEPAELPPVVTPPYLSGISLLELGLSFRARSCLEQAGIFTAADLGGVTSEFLLSLKNVGQKTAREIMEKVEELRRQFPQDAWEPTLSPGEEVLQTVAKRLADFTGMPQGELLRLLVPCREDAPDADAEAFLGLAFQQAPVRREARRAVLRLLEQYEEAVRLEDLLERLPAGTSLSTLKRLLGDLLRREHRHTEQPRLPPLAHCPGIRGTCVRPPAPGHSALPSPGGDPGGDRPAPWPVPGADTAADHQGPGPPSPASRGPVSVPVQPLRFFPGRFPDRIQRAGGNLLLPGNDPAQRGPKAAPGAAGGRERPGFSPAQGGACSLQALCHH
ncbi:MAG: hypothetical protein HFG09_08270 [Oscillibacter sp.]|nr:hypothetical protein [Oscillibacter sp.]